MEKFCRSTVVKDYAELLQRLKKETHKNYPLMYVLHRLVYSGEVAIFGGFVRDIALGRSYNDIDIVFKPYLEGRSALLDNLICLLEQDKNRSVTSFGGYRFTYKHQRFDIFQLEETWAFKNKKVTPICFENLPLTTYFSTDSICWHINKNKLFCLNNYLNLLQNGEFEIILAENPDVEKMQRRQKYFENKYYMKLKNKDKI